MEVILIAVIVLGAIGLIAAVVLFAVSKKFAVKEDPRIGQVSEVLPQANCGGCGFPGCSGMAAACVKAADSGSLDGLSCPVGGQEVMSKIADILGMKVEAASPKMAVVRCNGTCENRPTVNIYDGVKNCRIANTTCGGETGCPFGCLGCGDCVAACQFGAIAVNPATGIPEVDSAKCTACGACAKACPRSIIEVRNVKGTKKMALVVECMNKDKGAVAMKACKTACIGCMKCEKVCTFDAVHVTNNLAYIDPEKCKLCRKCEEACPKSVIHALNMPPKKAAPAKPAAARPAATPSAAKPTAKLTFSDNALLPAMKFVLSANDDVTPATKTAAAATPKAPESTAANNDGVLPTAIRIVINDK